MSARAKTVRLESTVRPGRSMRPLWSRTCRACSIVLNRVVIARHQSDVTTSTSRMAVSVRWALPSFEDKVAQRAIVMLLEPIYEQDFRDCSFGFRSGRNAHQALQVIHRGILGQRARW